MADQKGIDGVLSVNGVEITDVQDVSYGMSAGTIDATSRDDAGWTNNKQGLKSASVTVTILRDHSAATFQTLQAAFMAGTEITILDQASTGGSGYTGSFIVSGFDNGEPIAGMQTTDVTLSNAGVVALA